jgi:protein-tyrosine phosphatase
MYKNNKKINSIIFVCLGNICRSPLAEGIAKRYVKEKNLDIKIDSAGTGDWHVGENPCLNAIMVAEKNALDISDLVSRQVKKEDLENFDLVVALDDKNLSDLSALGAKNLVKLGDYGYDGVDVPDPYFFNGFEGFDKVYDMIHKCVINLIDENIK